MPEYDIALELAKLHILKGADFVRQLKMLTSLPIFKPIENEKDIFEKSSPNDKKLRDTIFVIIEEFFASNPDILLYQCETGDNRQDMRDRLFLKWFREYEHSDKFFIKVSTIIAEEVKNYTAMIVQKDNPQLNNIIKDFDEFVGFFQNKPQ